MVALAFCIDKKVIHKRSESSVLTRGFEFAKIKA